VVPFQNRTLLLPERLPPAKQAVVVGQLTVVSASCVTVVAADQVPLLKVNASPMRSTAMQKLLDGHEMAVSEYGLTAVVVAHVVPFHD
jgi:hypothetical protein